MMYVYMHRSEFLNAQKLERSVLTRWILYSRKVHVVRKLWQWKQVQNLHYHGWIVENIWTLFVLMIMSCGRYLPFVHDHILYWLWKSALRTKHSKFHFVFLCAHILYWLWKSIWELTISNSCSFILTSCTDCGSAWGLTF